MALLLLLLLLMLRLLMVIMLMMMLLMMMTMALMTLIFPKEETCHARERSNTGMTSCMSSVQPKM
eukprot:772116-Pyramimonas_sp.AAC.1